MSVSCRIYLGEKRKLALQKISRLTHWAGSEFRISRSLLLPGENLLFTVDVRPCLLAGLRRADPTSPAWLSTQPSTSPSAGLEGGAGVGWGVVPGSALAGTPEPRPQPSDPCSVAC